MKSKTVNLLEDTIKEELHGLSVPGAFTAPTIKEKMDHLTKLKYYLTKDTIKTVENQSSEWQQLSAAYIINEGLESRKCKELLYMANIFSKHSSSHPKCSYIV